MESITSNPNRFAIWFNMTHPDVYRPITADDVRAMAYCGLIRRYRYYSPSLDGKTIMGILQYEKMREKRPARSAVEDRMEPPHLRFQNCATNHCLFNQKIKREDRKSIASTVNLLEIKSAKGSYGVVVESSTKWA